VHWLFGKIGKTGFSRPFFFFWSQPPGKLIQLRANFPQSGGGMAATAALWCLVTPLDRIFPTYSPTSLGGTFNEHL